VVASDRPITLVLEAPAGMEWLPGDPVTLTGRGVEHILLAVAVDPRLDGAALDQPLRVREAGGRRTWPLAVGDAVRARRARPPAADPGAPAATADPLLVLDAPIVVAGEAALPIDVPLDATAIELEARSLDGGAFTVVLESPLGLLSPVPAEPAEPGAGTTRAALRVTLPAALPYGRGVAGGRWHVLVRAATVATEVYVSVRVARPA
jgi:hypothetical protein